MCPSPEFYQYTTWEMSSLLTLFRLGFLRVAQLGGKGGQKVPAAYLNCTDNYDVAKIKVKSVTDHQ